jgi:hypothetical protein
MPWLVDLVAMSKDAIGERRLLHPGLEVGADHRGVRWTHLRPGVVDGHLSVRELGARQLATERVEHDLLGLLDDLRRQVVEVEAGDVLSYRCCDSRLVANPVAPLRQTCNLWSAEMLGKGASIRSVPSLRRIPELGALCSGQPPARRG